MPNIFCRLFCAEKQIAFIFVECFVGCGKVCNFASNIIRK